MAFFSHKDKKTVFPERRNLDSMLWTSCDEITEYLRTDSKDIFVIRDNDKLSEAIEKKSASMNPSRKFCFFNGYVCYRLRDEQALYDLIQEIKQSRVRSVEHHQTTEENIALNDKIYVAEKVKERPEEHKKINFVEPKIINLEEVNDIKNRWSEEKLTEQLEEIESDIRKTEKFLESEKEDDSPQKDERKKRKSLGRKNQIMTRLTDSELVKFQNRVKKSGLPQGEYLRNAALEGKIIIEEHSITDITVLDELAMIRAELGRQGGLLKMIIKPNQGQRELAPREWTELITALKTIETMKEKVSELEVKMNVDSKTSIE